MITIEKVNEKLCEARDKATTRFADLLIEQGATDEEIEEAMGWYIHEVESWRLSILDKVIAGKVFDEEEATRH